MGFQLEIQVGNGVTARINAESGVQAIEQMSELMEVFTIEPHCKGRPIRWSMRPATTRDGKHVKYYEAVCACGHRLRYSQRTGDYKLYVSRGWEPPYQGPSQEQEHSQGYQQPQQGQQPQGGPGQDYYGQF